MISIAIAGSTERTTACAKILFDTAGFDIPWLLTPTPKPIGRNQIITQNPVHQFAISKQIPTVLINKKIGDKVKSNISNLDRPDFLLVVDFGYIIPNWLLSLPSQAPLNIHPSALPKWRGSSPGQFVLLSGETESAVSLIRMNDQLDQGPIVAQLAFTVQSKWTQVEYYQHSFTLITEKLPNLIQQLATGMLQPHPQPQNSPTPIARRLNKKDAFVPWEIISQSMDDTFETQANKPIRQLTSSPLTSSPSPLTSSSLTSPSPFASTVTIPAKIADHPVLTTLLENNVESLKTVQTHRVSTSATIIEHACRAFSPWPLVWTYIPTSDGQKRMQVLACQINANGLLELKKVKVEGLKETPWSEVKNIVTQS